MQEAHSRAKQHFAKAKARSKAYRSTQVLAIELQPGDRVLVRNLSERGGPGKLRSHWEDQVYVVVNRKGTSPVYEIKPEGQRHGKHRVMHRNQLLPCNFLPAAELHAKDPTSQHKQLGKTRQCGTRRENNTHQSEEDDDSYVEWEVVQPSGNETGDNRQLDIKEPTATEPIGPTEDETELEGEQTEDPTTELARVEPQEERGTMPPSAESEEQVE